MKAISRRSRMSAPFILAAILTLAPAGLYAQKGSSCKCEDVPALLNLLNIDSAAVAELEEYQKTVTANEYFNEILPEPNPARMTKGGSLMDAIKQAMDRVGDSSVRKELSCMSVDKVKGQRNSDKNAELNQFLLLKDYVREQIDAYNLEIKKILSHLGNMERSCRPNDWFGTITYSETNEHKIQIIVFPDPNTTVMGVVTFLGSQENMSETTSRKGTIRLDGSSRTASSWTASGVIHKNKASKGMTGCTGGLRPYPPDTPTMSGLHTTEMWSGEASSTEEVLINMDEPDQPVTINFGIASIEVKASFEETSAASGCPGTDLPARTLRIPDRKFTWHGGWYQISAPVTVKDPERLSGTDVRGCMPVEMCNTITEETKDGDGRVVGSQESKKTMTAVVTYRLYKLKPVAGSGRIRILR